MAGIAGATFIVPPTFAISVDGKLNNSAMRSRSMSAVEPTITRAASGVAHFHQFLGCGFAGSALAAMDSAGSTSGQNAAPSAQAPSRISQRLHDDLTKAGFTDITIMPSSFLFRAKDSQGNPVMMVINPDVFTEMTEHSQGTEHKDAPLAGAIKGEPNSPIPSPPPKR